MQTNNARVRYSYGIERLSKLRRNIIFQMWYAQTLFHKALLVNSKPMDYNFYDLLFPISIYAKVLCSLIRA